MSNYQAINAKYGIIMLNLAKASKAEIKANADKNIALALKHKEVADFFGKDVFSGYDAKRINAAHDLAW